MKEEMKCGDGTAPSMNNVKLKSWIKSLMTKKSSKVNKNNLTIQIKTKILIIKLINKKSIRNNKQTQTKHKITKEKEKKNWNRINDNNWLIKKIN